MKLIEGQEGREEREGVEGEGEMGREGKWAIEPHWKIMRTLTLGRLGSKFLRRLIPQLLDAHLIILPYFSRVEEALQFHDVDVCR